MGSPALLLRTDAVCLVAASTIAFVMGAFQKPIAGVGFGDAHELALIAGLLLWTAAPRPCWQLASAGVHALFAAANLAHWETFVSGNIVAAGCLTTAMHVLFIALECRAARSCAVSGSLAGAAEAA